MLPVIIATGGCITNTCTLCIIIKKTKKGKDECIR
jgi:hypothetical protein